MSYLAQRLLHGAGVVLGVSVIVFGLTWLRGDPTSVLVPRPVPSWGNMLLDGVDVLDSA